MARSGEMALASDEAIWSRHWSFVFRLQLLPWLQRHLNRVKISWSFVICPVEMPTTIVAGPII